jgi:dienelactone hydrolase
MPLAAEKVNRVVPVFLWYSAYVPRANDCDGARLVKGFKPSSCNKMNRTYFAGQKVIEVKTKEGDMKLKLAISALVLGLLETSAQAKIVTKSVTYEHDKTALEGYLAYDDSIKGKRPGVLVVHEWWGLNDYARKRAEQLAHMGYVAFALDMYGKGKVTTHPQEASEWAKQITANVDFWGERALAGLKVLEKDPRVDPNRLAAIGYCFGGSTVQQLAYMGANLRGIVSFHGSLIPPTEEQAKRVKAKILICDGAADPMNKPDAVENYIASMNKTTLDWVMIIYAGAEHGFTNPDAGKAGIEGVKYSKSADQRSWRHMKDFFHEIFAK